MTSDSQKSQSGGFNGSSGLHPDNQSSVALDKPKDSIISEQWNITMCLPSKSTRAKCECECVWDAEAAFGGAHRFVESAGLQPELPGAAFLSGSDPSAARHSRSPLWSVARDRRRGRRKKEEKQTNRRKGFQFVDLRSGPFGWQRAEDGFKLAAKQQEEIGTFKIRSTPIKINTFRE